MIVFELICAGQHRFEGWFGSGDEFDRQRDGGLLACPVCSSAEVRKLPTAKIKRSDTEVQAASPESKAAAAPANPQVPAHVQQMQMMAMIDKILANSENVGDKFAEEARRIHREEAPQRSIRGVASREETEALLDEGVPILPLPVPPTGEWH